MQLRASAKNCQKFVIKKALQAFFNLFFRLCQVGLFAKVKMQQTGFIGNQGTSLLTHLLSNQFAFQYYCQIFKSSIDTLTT